MDKLHIGHTDDENYEPFGKLSDGTLVYRYSPPPPPDPRILREEQEKKKRVIDEYNESIQLKSTDTSQFLQTFDDEQIREKETKIILIMLRKMHLTMRYLIQLKIDIMFLTT